MIKIVVVCIFATIVFVLISKGSPWPQGSIGCAREERGTLLEAPQGAPLQMNELNFVLICGFTLQKKTVSKILESSLLRCSLTVFDISNGLIVGFKFTCFLKNSKKNKRTTTTQSHCIQSL